jgi:hypothetical protein
MILNKSLLIKHVQEIRLTIEGRPVPSFADAFAAVLH